MGLSKISKDIKDDLQKYSLEKKVSQKQRDQRLEKAEKREERHRAMR